MKNKNELMDELYKRCSAEQDEYFKFLEKVPPKEIIDRAYEIILRNDILITFEADDLSLEQIQALLKLKYPLEECYCQWMKLDYSHMEMLRDVIDDFSNELICKNDLERVVGKNG